MCVSAPRHVTRGVLLCPRALCLSGVQALFSENEVLREIISTIDSSLLEELDMVDQMKREDDEAAAAMWWLAQKDCQSLEAEVAALQAQLAIHKQESASLLEDAKIQVGQGSSVLCAS